MGGRTWTAVGLAAGALAGAGVGLAVGDGAAQAPALPSPALVPGELRVARVPSVPDAEIGTTPTRTEDTSNALYTTTGVEPPPAAVQAPPSTPGPSPGTFSFGP